MKFKKMPAAALAVVTAAGLAACGGSSSGADDAVGIRVWGAEDDQALLSELIAGFEAQYPDVDFDIQLGVESESTAKDTILTDVEAAADVFAFASDQIYDLVNAGALADLRNYEEAFERYPGRTLDEIKAANSESSVAAATVNDTFYAFPMAGDNSYFLYYDSSVISEEDARSWDTILEAAQTAGKKAGGKYWDPVQSFGEIIAQGALDRNDPAAIQTSLDALVEGVTAAIE